LRTNRLLLSDLGLPLFMGVNIRHENMDKENKENKLSSDEMLHLLKKSKARPLSLDDILKPKKPSQEVAPPVPFDKNKPVIIPILADENISEMQEYSSQEEANEFHMKLIERLHKEFPSEKEQEKIQEIEEDKKEDKRDGDITYAPPIEKEKNIQKSFIEKVKEEFLVDRREKYFSGSCGNKELDAYKASIAKKQEKNRKNPLIKCPWPKIKTP